MFRFLYLGVVFLFFRVEIWAQSNNSPYSSFGIGDLWEQGLSRNSGMAGVGIGLGSATGINALNPASYAHLQLTSIDLSLFYKYTNLKTLSRETALSTSGVQGLVLSFPAVKKGLGITIGVLPYSSVGYQVVKESRFLYGQRTDSLLSSHSGEGGINDLFFGFAFKPLKRLSLGFNLSYLFGTINEYQTASIIVPNSILTLYNQHNSYQGVKIHTGIQYHDTLKNGVLVRLGGVFTLPTTLYSTEMTILSLSQTSSQGIRSLLLDTLVNNLKSVVSVPPVIGFGVCFEKPNKFMLGIDGSVQNWSSSNLINNSLKLQSSYRFKIGSEYVPDATSRKFVKNIAYRIGAKYEQTAFIINGISISQMGFTFGFGLPVTRQSSRLNIGFEIGSRGTTEGGLIAEIYYQGYFGISFNERWFHRKKIE